MRKKNIENPLRVLYNQNIRLFKAFNQECVDNIGKSYLFAFVLGIRTIVAISWVSEQCPR